MEALHRIHCSLKGREAGEIRSLRAWIRCLVARQCHDAIDARARDKSNLTGDEAMPEPSTGALTEAQVIGLIDQDRRLGDLRRCIEGIETRVGEALRLWLQGSTYARVAAELAYKSLSSAQSAVQAATRKVASCMARKGWGEGA